MRHEERNLIRARGLILPAGWDPKGNVVNVCLATFDEKEYLIDHDGKEGSLLSHLQKEVEIIGLVREEDGIKIIRIKEYRLNNQ